MRQAFMLLGVMTCIVSVGAYFAFSRQGTQKEDMNSKNTEESSFSITSQSFKEGGKIHSKYTCDGDNISPGIDIQNAPEGTVSFVLVMDDPDIPESVRESRNIEKFDHWAVYNISGELNVIPEAHVIGMDALNGRGETSYIGPCPPDTEHRYFFRLYALREMLYFEKTPTLDELEKSARTKMISSATLMGRYERIRQ